VKRNRSLIEQASDAIFINDINGDFLDVNESACKCWTIPRWNSAQWMLEIVTDELSRRPIMFKELLNGEQTLLERIMIDKMDLP
jgi:PAS domain-containing protein